MIECPRCGATVDRLEPIPRESLRSGLPDDPETEGNDRTGRACESCRLEIIEK